MNKALFWDFDGTLVKANRKWSSSLETALSAAGMCLEPNDIGAAMRAGNRRYGPLLEYPDRIGDMWWADLFERFHHLYSQLGVPEDLFTGIDTRVHLEILDAGNYALYDDTQDTLRLCSELGFVNYVLSNNFPDLSVLVDNLGILKHFKAVVSSGAVGYEKPHASIFEFARMAAGGPDISVMVGDNPATDISGATAAGFITVQVHTEPHGEIAADHYCDELSQIPAVLAKII